jgi:hypothetical protein
VALLERIAAGEERLLDPSSVASVQEAHVRPDARTQRTQSDTSVLAAGYSFASTLLPSVPVDLPQDWQNGLLHLSSMHPRMGSPTSGGLWECGGRGGSRMSMDDRRLKWVGMRKICSACIRPRLRPGMMEWVSLFSSMETTALRLSALSGPPFAGARPSTVFGEDNVHQRPRQHGFSTSCGYHPAAPQQSDHEGRRRANLNGLQTPIAHLGEARISFDKQCYGVSYRVAGKVSLPWLRGGAT